MASTPPEHDPERTPLERLVPELLKRVVETGTKNLNAESLRQLVGELKLPKEALSYTFSQLDETKNGVYRIIGKEVRDILEKTNLSEELAKALSLLTLEVKMEVRFKPSESQGKGSPLAASVKVKRSERSSEPSPSSPQPDQSEKTEE